MQTSSGTGVGLIAKAITESPRSATQVIPSRTVFVVNTLFLGCFCKRNCIDNITGILSCYIRFLLGFKLLLTCKMEVLCGLNAFWSVC